MSAEPTLRVACTECAHQVPPGTLGRCPDCGGILQPHYSDEAVQSLAAIPPGSGLDRYRALMPVRAAIPYLGEGDTPLIRSRRLGPSLGLKHLLFKVEGRNPSGAFKDRPGALVAALALDAGSPGVLTASSGNAASAIAAYAAAAGLKCMVLMEPGNPPAKLRQTLASGAQVVYVDGIFRHGPQAIADLMTRVAAESGYYLAFVWAPVNPYVLESIKSIAYEVVARLPGPPDVVVNPVGGGDLLAAQWRGYRELQRAGVIERLPRMVGVQSESAPPLLQAFREGASHVSTLPEANSRISGINVPFSGDHALAAIRESGGVAAGVTDEEALALQARVGVEEGIWVEPVPGVTLAALETLLAGGHIAADERIVCVLTGAGFKDAHLAAEQADAASRQSPLPFDAETIIHQIKP